MNQDIFLSLERFNRRCYLFQTGLEKGLIFSNKFLDELTLSGSFENYKNIKHFSIHWFPIMFREVFQ